MKEIKRLENGGVNVDNQYLFTPYKKGESEKFGVFTVDNTLLHPDITDKKLLKYELYSLYNDPFCYGGTHKGQLVLGLIFHSVEEMYKVYIELKKMGYKKVKVQEEYRESEISEKLYDLDTVDQTFNFFRCGCILTVQIKAKDLMKFKKDLSKMREILGYRCMWGSEDLYTNYKYSTRLSLNIID